MFERKSRLCYLFLLSALLFWQSVSSCLAADPLYFKDGSSDRYEDSGYPIYSPPLPPSEFLFEDQKKLAEAIGDDLSKFVEFVDSDVSVSEGVMCPLKPWSKEEKEDITGILSCLLRRGPGVLVRAAATGPVKLARAASFKGSTAFGNRSNSFVEEVAPLAAAHECSIVLSDRFFRCNQQAHGLIHELVHIADSGDRTAFSKEWATFALPEISKIRKMVAPMNRRQIASYQRNFRKQGEWPSLYATVNLREALAEYMSEYVMGTEFAVKPEFITKIGAPFLSPTDNDLKWLSSVQSGMALMGRKDYKNAISRFDQAIELVPWSPVPYLFVAHCSAHAGKDFARSDKSIGKAIACFDEAGIPPQEPDTKLLVPLRASVLAEQGDFTAALKLLDQVLLESPDYREALALRSWCRYQRGLLWQAADDYYLAKCGPDDYKWARFIAPSGLGGIVRDTTYGGSPERRSSDAERRSIILSIKKIMASEKSGNKNLALAQYNATVKKVDALERRLSLGRSPK